MSRILPQSHNDSNVKLMKNHQLNESNMINVNFKTQANEQLLAKYHHSINSFEIDYSNQKKSSDTESLNRTNPKNRANKNEQSSKDAYQEHYLIEKQQYQQHQYQNHQKESFYPIFLNMIGNCVAPCLITCPCFRCGSCCANPPLFQQTMKDFGILQRWGKYSKLLAPGLHVINPISQKVIEINRQTKTLAFQQIVFTKDNVQFVIDTVVFYRIFDSTKLAYRLGSSNGGEIKCVMEIGQACLRNIVGVNILQHVIEKRELISQKLKKELNANLSRWGIHVQTCALKGSFLQLFLPYQQNSNQTTIQKNIYSQLRRQNVLCRRKQQIIKARLRQVNQQQIYLRFYPQNPLFR